MGVQTPQWKGEGVLATMTYKERLHTKEVLFKPQVHPVRVGVSRQPTHLIQLPASSQHFMRRLPSILGGYVRDVLFFSGR